MIVLALLIEGESHVDEEVDGVTATLPTFGTDYASIAVECAAALKEADPGASVTLELQEVECDWTAVEALGQAVDALQLVLTVATAWRYRCAAAAIA